MCVKLYFRSFHLEQFPGQRLDIPQRVQYNLGVTVHWCLQYKTPQYLMDCFTLTSDVSSRQRLRSANRH